MVLGKALRRGKAILLAKGGKARNRHRIALAAGSVLLILGLIATSWAIVPDEGTRTRTIPAVPDLVCPPNRTGDVGLWILVKFSFWYQGELSCSLSFSPALSPQQAGYNLGWLLMGQSSFEYYKETGLDRGVVFFILTDHESLSDIHLPTTGTYYLVLANQDPIDSEYNVTVYYRLTGLNIEFFALGLSMLLVACPVLFFARRWKRKEV